jgi:hypothetical protein
MVPIYFSHSAFLKFLHRVWQIQNRLTILFCGIFNNILRITATLSQDQPMEFCLRRALSNWPHYEGTVMWNCCNTIYSTHYHSIGHTQWAIWYHIGLILAYTLLPSPKSQPRNLKKRYGISQIMQNSFFLQNLLKEPSGLVTGALKDDWLLWLLIIQFHKCLFNATHSRHVTNFWNQGFTWLREENVKENRENNQIQKIYERRLMDKWMYMWWSFFKLAFTNLFRSN